MAVQGIKRSGKNVVSLLLASTVLGYVGFVAAPASAQSQQSGAVASPTVGFNIPAQPLGRAINSFISATGWQIGYSSALVDGKQSTVVSGKLTPETALRTLLSGTGIEIRMTGPKTASLLGGGQSAVDASDSTLLSPIQVQSKAAQSVLGTSSVADTGTSTISGGQLNGRTGGSGDANSVLRNMANVQYQNEISNDSGVTDQSVIDLKPKEVSISGARVYENNFILNGMEINNLTGSLDQFISDSTLATTGNPNMHQVYGLHSQTIYVPTDFVSATTVIDSNASARYGNFQGGVVLYDLERASKDRWRGAVTTDYTTSDWAEFNLLTPSGLNPNNVARNDYIRRRSSVSATGPITDNIAVIGQYSTQSATTHKDKAYRFIENPRVGENSQSDFYRLQAEAETDFGDFILEGIYTDYDQSWKSPNWRDLDLNLGSNGLTSRLQHDYEFEDFDLGGVALSNVKLTSKLSYKSSETINESDSNWARTYARTFVRNRSIVWDSKDIADWCRSQSSTTNTTCSDGGIGTKEQGQEQFSFSQDMSGDVFLGTFAIGADYTHTDAYRRRPEELVNYSNSLSTAAAGVSAFVCNGADECSAEQFAINKSISPAYNINVKLNSFNAYAELDQTWEWLNIRAGLRASYDDYMKNIDIAPRIVTTITPFEDFSISVGYNRYYNATNLGYAIRERLPRDTISIRTHDSGKVLKWGTPRENVPYRNTAAGLETPYNDEITFGLSGKDPILDGQWRLRFLDRRSKNQFATETISTYVNQLTNSGHGAYQSITGEYSKELNTGNIEALDALSFKTSLTWARSEISNKSYFEDNLEDDHIWYRDQSYSKAGFNVVTGNMDIPLRLQAGFGSSWFDNRLNVDVSANYNFGFNGVYDTGRITSINGLPHAMYEDFDFDPTLTVDLAASYEVYKNDDRGLMFNVKVGNLFNETGNAKTSDARPWNIGRTVWVGAKATF